MPAPRYPVYVPSKGRAGRSLTTEYLATSDVGYRMVVEPQEADAYRDTHGADRVLVLPFRDRGVAASRSWIKDHARDEGHARHWQMDDDIKMLRVWRSGKRPRIEADPALATIEDFVDRYENIAIAGLQHTAFGFDVKTPFSLNQQVYGVVLVNNELTQRWRGLAEDTDFSLQVLSAGWCTVLFRAFQLETVSSGTNAGGHADAWAADGRARRVRDLQRRWPRLIKATSRWGRPCFDAGHLWRRFDTPLRRRDEA